MLKKFGTFLKDFNKTAHNSSLENNGFSAKLKINNYKSITYTIYQNVQN
jgi:hypothetical protein